MIYQIIAIIASIVIPIIIVKNQIKTKEKTIKQWVKENYLPIATYLMLMIGFMVRLIGIVDMPNGFNTDEASIGYEAYSLLHYGIDRNGNSWPVFLEAWGSGQNALYLYIIMPFVKLLGLSILSVRLPMAIIGCISLVVMYQLLRKTKNDKLATIGLAFFAICPWHIMKSRYGLESNVFPDFALWGVFCYGMFIQNKKIGYLYVGSILLGLCAYAYGTSYYFLPVFLVIVLIMLLKNKKIKIKQAIIAFSIVSVIALPIVLMLMVNTFEMESIKIGNITIPRLESNRYETLTVLSSDNMLATMKQNFVASVKMLLKQNDGYAANALKYYGIIYLFSVPITIIGLIASIRKRDEIDKIFLIWLFVASLLMFICIPNINRMNIMYIPLIYYTVLGLYEISITLNKIKPIFIVIYAIAFINFGIQYIKTDFTETYTFYDKIENVISYAKNIEAKTIYCQYAFKEPYIYFLFYQKENTEKFVNTVKYKNNVKGFDSVASYGNIVFSLPKKLEDQENNAYIMKKSEEKKYTIDDNVWKRTEIDDFIILEKK